MSHFTQVPNELYEALSATPFNGRQLRIIHTIIRLTNGFHKKGVSASLGFLSQKTGIDPADVSRVLKELRDWHVLSVESAIGRSAAHYSVLNPTEWKIESTPTTGINESKNGTSAPASLEIVPKDNPDPRFVQFWTVYPRKVAKQHAEKAFKKLEPSDELLAQMIEATEQAKKTEGWSKDGGKYIPHPATWINGRRWEDEIETSTNGATKTWPTE